MPQRCPQQCDLGHPWQLCLEFRGSRGLRARASTGSGSRRNRVDGSRRSSDCVTRRGQMTTHFKRSSSSNSKPRYPAIRAIRCYYSHGIMMKGVAEDEVLSNYTSVSRRKLPLSRVKPFVQINLLTTRSCCGRNVLARQLIVFRHIIYMTMDRREGGEEYIPIPVPRQNMNERKNGQGRSRR